MNYPNENGFFGQFGGRYVSDDLMPILEELTKLGKR